MKAGNLLFSALIAVLLWACGEDKSAPQQASSTGDSTRDQVIAEALASPEFRQACADTPGCADPPRFPAPAEAETIWRVLVVREASGTIRIDRIEAAPVPAGDGVPVGPLSGSHRLVGLDSGGQPIDGQLLRFPDVMRIEHEPAVGIQPSEEVDVSGREVGTIGFVRALPAVVAIAVQDESGATLVKVVIPPPVSQLWPGWDALVVEPAFAASGQPAVWPYAGNIPPYCAHVLILEGEADRALAQDIAYEDELIELVSPGPYQRAVIFAALRRMTPLLCQSVRRIALGVLPAEVEIAGAVHTISTGDMMLINVADSYSERSLQSSDYYRVYMIGTIIHEAAHSADALITVQGSLPQDFAGDWIMPARTLAAQTIDRVRIEKGLREEWARVHQSFLTLDWAKPHQTSDQVREAVYAWSPGQISDGGFMSHYGATSLHDDIAEMVEGTYITELYLRRGWPEEWTTGDFACQEMREHRGRDLPSRFTAVYTKLMLLKDLGLLYEEDVESCMGPDIGLPIDSGGFHFSQDGNLLRSFGSNLTAKMGTNEAGQWIYEMEAEGEASFGQEMYPAKFQLRLGVAPPGTREHLVAWPRGVYKVELAGPNTVRMRLEEMPAGGFDVKDGYVLVAEASNERIAGSIIFTVAMRFGAPLPVPQTWRPPMVVRFLIEH